MGRVELRGVNQKEEFVRRVKEAAGSNFHACLRKCCDFCGLQNKLVGFMVDFGLSYLFVNV